jgi:hypothetical protein
LTASKGQKLPDSEGHPIPDFAIIEDPRSADWIRIVGVYQRTGVALPDWAALWLWWLRNNVIMTFWRRVGRLAREIGFPPLPPTAEDDDAKPVPPSIVILHRLREGEPPIGQLSPSEEHWLRTAFTFLRRIDYWRRKSGSGAHCIFQIGLVYFQCLAPTYDRYLRCEAVSAKYVPEVGSIMTPEKRQKLTNELGFSEPGASKNFSRKIQIEGQRDLAFVARLAFRVLRDVYGVGDFEPAKFKIDPALA